MHFFLNIFFALAYSITTIAAVTPSPTGAPGNPYFRQVGQDIVGASTDTNLGTSVSVSDDGKVVAVSGIESIVNEQTSQKEFVSTVTVYQESGNFWNGLGLPIQGVEVGEFRGDGKAGTTLSGDGKRLAIATVYKSERGVEGTPAGVVRVYSHDLSDISTNWQLIATPYEGTAGGGGALIGLKVSMDETGIKLAVGERYYDAVTENNADNTGRILVYNIAADGTVSANGAPIVGTSPGDNTGSSVMISSDGYCLVFGSIGSDSTGTDSGSASVYCWVTNAWVFRQKLDGEALGDLYGFSAAISADGSYVAIGATKNDPDLRVNAGHVRVFAYSETDQYEQLGSDIDGETGETSVAPYYVGDFSGYSMGISELDADSGLIRIAIGAPNNRKYYGQVRLYECSPLLASPVWTRVLYDLDGETPNGGAGESVAISSDGKRIVIGSPGVAEYYAGAVRIFEQTEYSAKPSLSPSPSQAPSTLPSVSTNTSEDASGFPSVSLSPSSASSNVPTSVNPSGSPSNVPSLSINPSAAPSDLPSVALSPSAAPSDLPSLSINSSTAPRNCVHQRFLNFLVPVIITIITHRFR